MGALETLTFMAAATIDKAENKIVEATKEVAEGVGKGIDKALEQIRNADKSNEMEL